MITIIDIKNAKDYVEKEINKKDFDTPIQYAKAMHKILSDVTIKFTNKADSPATFDRATEIFNLYAAIISLTTYNRSTKSIFMCSDDIVLSLYDKLSYLTIYSQYTDYDTTYKVNIQTCTVIDEDDCASSDMIAIDKNNSIINNYNTFSDYSNICTDIIHIKEHLLKVLERCENDVYEFSRRMKNVLIGAKHISNEYQKLVAAVFLTTRFYSNGGAAWDTYENIYLVYKALKNFYDSDGNITGINTEYKEDDTGTIYLVDILYHNIINITFNVNKNKYLNPIKNNFNVLGQRTTSYRK